MAAKDSKAMLEVWEWKEKLNREVKDMSWKELIAYIKKNTTNTVKEIKADSQNIQDSNKADK